MRIFVQKQPQQQVFSSPIRSNTAASGLNLHAHPILHLQRAIGNQAVRRLLEGGREEQEADTVAEEVMRMPDDGHCGMPEVTQRLCQDGKEEQQEGLQRKRTASDTEEIDDRRVESKILALQGNGSRLPESSHAFFESRFRHNFSSVRVHTDARAARLARDVNARAFTLGGDIVFGAGEYSPGTREGKYLLAHELAHVVQQEQVQPHIQRLTITRHTVMKGTCGERNVKWVFSLDEPAPEDGYFVQQIDKKESVENCPNLGGVGLPNQSLPFWEAWFVKKGDKGSWVTDVDGWTDSSERPFKLTDGMEIITGEVKFFEETTTGDLGDLNEKPEDPGSSWGPGKVQASGGLPSTSSKPSWWDDAPVEGPAERVVRASWRCCSNDKRFHSHDLKVDP